MTESAQNGFVVMIVIGIIGAMMIGLSIYDFYCYHMMQRLEGKTRGNIIGLVKSHLFRNETHGNVPGGALMGWGVSQGEQYWGGMLKVRIPPWFPCVTFTVGENEICRIMGEGVKKGIWEIGQQVTILYDPKNPRISMIENDISQKEKAKAYLIIGIILVLISVVSGAMFLK